MAVLVLALLPYAQTLAFGFTLDDANTIEGHRGVKEPLSFDDIVLRDSWGRSRFDTIGTWRPLATLTFWVDQRVAGGRPWPFHLANLVYYAAFIALAEWFLAKWCPSLSAGARWLALAAFGALAIHAGTVPSPTGAADLLAAFFSLAAIAAATCGEELGPREVALSAGALFLALVAKESSAPIGLLVPLLAHRAHAARGTLRRGPILALGASCVAALTFIWGFRALKMPFMDLGPDRAPENPLLAVDAPHRLLGALEVLALYLRNSFTGAMLAPDYSYAEPPLLRDGPVGIALGAAVVLALGLLLFRAWNRAPRLADAVLALGASYFAVSNVAVAASAIADRLFYFPSFWLVVIVAMALDGAVRGRAGRGVACAAAMAFALIQAQRAAADASTWTDDRKLLGAAARLYPNVYRTQRNLAHACADDARDDDAAFHLAAGEAIFAEYPAPVARDAISPTWDSLPLGERLARLRGAGGPRVTCDAVGRAAPRIRSWGDARAADALEAWSKSECGARE